MVVTIITVITVVATLMQASSSETCYNSYGRNMTSGSCSGDWCMERYLGGSAIGSEKYARGCLSLYGKYVSKKLDHEFSCDYDSTIPESRCFCSGASDCNGNPFYTANKTNGKYECFENALTNATCRGDACLWGSNGVWGCQMIDTPLARIEILNFTSAYCMKAILDNSEGNSSVEICRAYGDHSNWVRPNVTYMDSRARIPCVSDQGKNCTGHACHFLETTVGKAKPAYDLECLLFTDNLKATPHCMEFSTKDLALKECYCTDANCNKDWATALKSVGYNRGIKKAPGFMALFIGFLMVFMRVM